MLKSNAFTKTQQRMVSAMSVPYTLYAPLHHRVVHTDKAFGHTRKTGRKYVLVDAVFTVIFFKRSIRKGHKIRDGRFNLINRHKSSTGFLILSTNAFRKAVICCDCKGIRCLPTGGLYTVSQ